MYAVSTGVFLWEPIRHFANHVKILNHHYEWPNSRAEYNIFFKEVFKMNGFWSEMFKKVSFGLVSGGGNMAIKLALWQHIFGGTFSPDEYVDYNMLKNFVPALLVGITTCYLGVPFENARRAYYADKTWPVELRRNYKSPLRALLRIPVEEGPYYLFKGGFPIAMHSFMFWSGFLTMYSWLKNKAYYMWVYNDFGYNYIKTLLLGFSFFFSAMLAYPAYYTREMVDLWPKERGGHCTFNNNYRVCFRWMLDSLEMLYFNFMPGFWMHFLRQGMPTLIALWIADNVGMFSNCLETYNGIEFLQPIQAEAI